MECDTFQIVTSATGWRLRLNGELLNLFDRHEDAQRAAIVAARLLHQRGRLVEIIADSVEDGEPLSGTLP